MKYKNAGWFDNYEAGIICFMANVCISHDVAQQAHSMFMA